MKQAITTPYAEHLELDSTRFQHHPDNNTRSFPDGELYTRLEAVDSIDEALLVHAGMPEPNNGLEYLRQALHVLDEHSVETDVFFTYFPYGMQDEAFRTGEVNRAEALIDELVSYHGVGTVHVLDAHFANRDWVDTYPVQLHSAFNLLTQDIDDSYRIVAPDLGSMERYGITGFEKDRQDAYTVSLRDAGLDLSGERVMVFDDIIETGGTMVEAYHAITEMGADRVEAAAVHGVLSDGVERVQDAYDAFHLTNSIDSRHADTRIEPIIRDVLG